MSPNDEPKFRRRAEERPDEILDAALELFLEKGFERTRVAEIAERAGLSKGAVYLYFDTKEALLEGLVRRAVIPAADQALQMITAYRGDPRPLIGRVMRMLAGRILNTGAAAVPRLVLRESLIAPELAEMYRREVLARIIPAVEALIAQGVEGGHIRKVDPEMTIRSIVGPILAHLMLAEVFGIKPADGLAVDRLIDNHLAILLAGLEPEATP